MVIRIMGAEIQRVELAVKRCGSIEIPLSVERVGKIVIGCQRQRILQEGLTVVYIGLGIGLTPEIPVSLTDFASVGLCRSHRRRKAEHQSRGKEFLAYPPLAHEHLYDEKYQSNSEKIHILFIKVLKNHRFEPLCIHTADFVYDRIQTEFAIAGPYIDSVPGRSHFLKHGLVKPGNHDVTLLVLKQSAIIRDRFPLRRTDPYAVDFNAHFGSLFGDCHRIVFVILPVGYQDDRPAAFALRAETPYRSHQRIPYRRTLYRYGFGRYRIEENLCRNIVCGYRKLYEGSPCEYHKTYPVIPQAVDKARYREFRPLEPVGGIVFGQHRIGHIQGYDYLRPPFLLLFEPCAYLRSHQTDDEEEEGCGKQRQPHPAFRPRLRRHQSSDQFRIADSGNLALAQSPHYPVDDEKYRDEQKQEDILSVCEIYHIKATS